MSNDAGTFFARAMDSASHDDETESTIVGKIAVRFSLGKDRVQRAARAVTNRAATLSWFNRAYPSFPFFMGYRKTKWQHKALVDFEKRFTKTPCFIGWQEVAEGIGQDDERPVACFFRWPELGLRVIRKVMFAECPAMGETATYVSVGNSRGDVSTFVIESFPAFLGRIAWDPPMMNTD